jgi:hypothetical protein
MAKQTRNDKRCRAANGIDKGQGKSEAPQGQGIACMGRLAGSHAPLVAPQGWHLCVWLTAMIFIVTRKGNNRLTYFYPQISIDINPLQLRGQRSVLGRIKALPL